MIGTVDDRDLNRFPAQSLGGEQAGEPAADDRDLMRRPRTESGAARITTHTGRLGEH
jgi:hypothetical protein